MRNMMINSRTSKGKLMEPTFMEEIPGRPYQIQLFIPMKRKLLMESIQMRISTTQLEMQKLPKCIQKAMNQIKMPQPRLTI